MVEVFSTSTSETVVMQNSFGVVKGPDKRTMTTKIYISDSNPNRGGFEWYSDDYYAEGGLWFDDNGFLRDYDGVFSLPPVVAKWLVSEGRMTQQDILFWTEEGVLS